MPNTMPGNIAKGRFLAQLDKVINGLPEVDPSNLDRTTLRAELKAFTAGEPDYPLITKREDVPLPAPNCLVDKWIKPIYTTSSPTGLKRWKRDRRHVYMHWFPNPPWKGKLGGDPGEDEKSSHGGWFEEHQPVARVVRQGLIHALDLLAGGMVDPDDRRAVYVRDEEVTVGCHHDAFRSHEVAVLGDDVLLSGCRVDAESRARAGIYHDDVSRVEREGRWEDRQSGRAREVATAGYGLLRTGTGIDLVEVGHAVPL